MSTLSQFINDLATNLKLQQDFLDDPAATMQSYGLQSHEIDAVLAGDKVKVEQLTGHAVLPVTFIFPAK
ncbi:hypothetical protein SAMN06297280_1352 [Arsukibacterium tuosuense]|uniref:Extradiol ring-cleavage dioxygenase LigAB LigA subunit domain-containing protein n=1 Tax=Arsukibacterium tuosuense TaxID=1323745 RepID=A0A285IN60_9GAMM|nr:MULTISPECIES: hypothetical protein [Arsukibacterium]SNY49323.1 hypothetical protein SAMN06297280_1352 [Arsukibacterium tuosuense]